MHSKAESILTAEYSVVRDSGAGVIDLSSRGRILVSGSEAVMFLNGLVTNDMKSLGMNSWMPAAFANVQGRLLAAVRIIHHADGFLLETEESTHEAVMRLIERFTLANRKVFACPVCQTESQDHVDHLPANVPKASSSRAKRGI